MYGFRIMALVELQYLDASDRMQRDAENDSKF